MKHKIVPILAAAALTLAASGASAATIIGAVSATASNTTPGFGIGHTIDQSGLSVNYVSGVTDFDTYIGLSPMHSLSASTEWFGALGSTSATVEYDLGAVFSIDRLALWNEESSGFGTGLISVSTDGITYSNLTTINPFDNPLADYPAEVFGFAATSLRYFRMELSGCPQIDPGSYNSCAIGEVAFATAAAVPVPASLPLLVGALGAFGFLRRKRNKSVA